MAILEYITKLNNSEFKRGMKENLEATKHLDGAFDGLTSKIAKGMSIERLAEKGLDMVMEFGKGVIDATVNYERFSARLSTLLNGNKEAAETLHNSLVEISSASGIKLADIEESTIQLNIYGVAAGNITDTLKTFGQISIATGIDLKSLSEQYGRIIEAGAVSSRTLRIFQKEGIDLQGQLQKNLHKTGDAFDEMLKKGQISASEVTRAFEDMTTGSGKFAGQMEEQAKTLGGQLNKMGTTWEELKVNIGKSQTGILSSTITWLNSMIDGFNKYYEAKNLIDKSNASGFSFVEKYLSPNNGYSPLVSELDKLTKHSPTLGEKHGENADLQLNRITSQLQSSFPKSEKPGQMAYNNLNLESIEKYITGQAKVQNGFLTAEQNRYLSVIKTMIDENKASLAGLSNKTNKADKTKIETPAEKETPRENIVVNITKLVETLEVHSLNLREGAQEIKEIIAATLQEAVYGVKLLGR